MATVYLCGSRKPAPHKTESKSAARSLLKLVMGMNPNEEQVFVDLRDYDLPFFDGRSIEEYESPDLIRLHRILSQADKIVMSVPSYWGGVCGVLKNALDVLGGAKYDHPEESTVLQNKLIGVIVVGAEDLSAYNGAAQIRTILQTMGAWVLPQQVVVGNLRHATNMGALAKELKDFAVRMNQTQVPAAEQSVEEGV